MAIIRCPVCDQDHQGNTPDVVAMLVNCGVLEIVDHHRHDQCPCGFKCSSPRNMINHLTDTFHDWPALLVRRELENM